MLLHVPDLCSLLLSCSILFYEYTIIYSSFLLFHFKLFLVRGYCEECFCEHSPCRLESIDIHFLQPAQLPLMFLTVPIYRQQILSAFVGKLILPLFFKEIFVGTEFYKGVGGIVHGYSMYLACTRPWVQHPAIKKNNNLMHNKIPLCTS